MPVIFIFQWSEQIPPSMHYMGRECYIQAINDTPEAILHGIMERCAYPWLGLKGLRARVLSRVDSLHNRVHAWKVLPNGMLEEIDVAPVKKLAHSLPYLYRKEDSWKLQKPGESDSAGIPKDANGRPVFP